MKVPSSEIIFLLKVGILVTIHSRSTATVTRDPSVSAGDHIVKNPGIPALTMVRVIKAICSILNKSNAPKGRLYIQL